MAQLRVKWTEAWKCQSNLSWNGELQASTTKNTRDSNPLHHVYKAQEKAYISEWRVSAGGAVVGPYLFRCLVASEDHDDVIPGQQI